MPWRVWREWLQYAEVEPFGAESLGLRIGYAAAALASMWGKPKNRKAWKASDFMPDFQRAARKPTPDDLFAKMVMVTKLMGGRVIDKRGKRGKSD
jgi:hypothetical protein